MKESLKPLLKGKGKWNSKQTVKPDSIQYIRNALGSWTQGAELVWFNPVTRPVSHR